MQKSIHSASSGLMLSKVEASKIKNILIGLLVLVFVIVFFGRPVWVKAVIKELEHGVVDWTPNQEELEFEVKEQVEYTLPWPGILPGHPFYFLKALRDRAWGFLVRDPLKKAEWALLMADKRVWAGQMLVEKGKETLGVSTLTKAEKYLEQALVKAEEAKAQGGNVDSFLGKLGCASLKHEEILGEALDLVSEESQAVIERMIEYPERIYEKAEELRE